MLYIEKKISEKSKKEYVALYLDKGEKTYSISFDKILILELFDIAPSYLVDMNVGEKLYLTIPKKESK